MKNAEWAIKFIRKHGMGALCECGKEDDPCLGCEAVTILEADMWRRQCCVEQEYSDKYQDAINMLYRSCRALLHSANKYSKNEIKMVYDRENAGLALGMFEEKNLNIVLRNKK